MKILLLGSTGFVGKNLVETLKGVHELFCPNSQELNLLRKENVLFYFRKHSPELVIHAAAHTGGIQMNIESGQKFFEINRMIDKNVFESAHEVKTPNLLYFGSNCTYSPQCQQPFLEEDIFSGDVETTNKGFALAKRESIQNILQFRSQGYRWSCIIPCSLYGYYDHFSPERAHVIPMLIARMIQAKKSNLPCFEVWGSGKQKREFLFAHDFSLAIKNLISSFSQARSILNIGSGIEISIEELAKELKELIQYRGEILFNPDKPTGMERKILATGPGKILLPKPLTALHSGLEKTISFYKEQSTSPAHETL